MTMGEMMDGVMPVAEEDAPALEGSYDGMLAPPPAAPAPPAARGELDDEEATPCDAAPMIAG